MPLRERGQETGTIERGDQRLAPKIEGEESGNGERWGKKLATEREGARDMP